MSNQNPERAPVAAIAIRQVEKNTGASRIAHHQMALLKEMGYQIVVLAEKANIPLIHAQGATFVHMRRWPFKGSFRRSWFNRRVQRWRKRHQPDLFISHGDAISNDIIFMHNCVHLASQRIHGRALPKGHEVASIHDKVLSQGDFKQVVANSHMMADDFRIRYGIGEDQLTVHYPGYDPKQFNPQRARQNRENVRKRFGVGKDEFLLGLVTSGNFKKRNLTGFIDIAALLDQHLHGRCKFLVVGKDDVLPYQQQAKAKGVEEKFIWRSTVKDVEELYGSLDLFVLPAHIEEFGCVVIEAMACATPVIVSSWTGAGELLSDKYSHLVMDSYAPEQWASRIESLLTSDPRLLGKTLAELVVDYSHQQQYEKLKELFKKRAPL